MNSEKNIAELTPITAKDLAITIKRDCQAGERFCFILGSGASRNSGIKTGREMISEWRKEMIEDYGGDLEGIRCIAERMGYSPSEWEEIFQDGYQPQSKHYFVMYDLMFGATLKAGYDYMQRAMANAKPSIGYYCLASILNDCSNKCNLVITTNFDSLTEDALFFYSGNHPLVLGHERMASFLNIDATRPIVAKVHRDVLLEPMSRKEEMDRLKDEWHSALKTILPYYVPIVVGYAGGDNTLMSLLQEKDIGCRKIYWCTHTSETYLAKDVNEIIRHMEGQWVEIEGFDELLYEIAERMHLVPNKERIVRASMDRIEQFKSTHEKFIVPMRLSTSKKNAPDQSSDHKKYHELITNGWELFWQGDKNTAIDLFTEAINIHPGLAEAYYYRGYALHSNKKYKASLEDLQTAVRIESDNETYHNKIGEILFDLNNFEQSLVHYRKATQLESTNPWFFDRCGNVLYAMKRYDEALLNNTQAINLQPKNAWYHHSRSKTYFAMKQFDEALADINKAIELDPSNAWYYHIRGTMAQELGKINDALDDKNKALKLEPYNPWYYHSRSLTLTHLGELKKALTDTNTALELEPMNPWYYHSRSMVYHEMGLLDECLNDYNRAINLEPENGWYFYRKSVILYEMHKYESALEFVDKAISLNPIEDQYQKHKQHILCKVIN